MRGRNSCRIGLAGSAAALVLAASCNTGNSAVVGAPGRPLENLSEVELGRFLLGKAVFERLTVPEEGLGPLYNDVRCSGCHDVPATGGSSVTHVQKAARWENDRCDLLEDLGGDNVQQHVTPLLAKHGLAGEQIPSVANVTGTIVAPPLFGLGLVESISEREMAARADPDDTDGDGISGRVGRTVDGSPGRFGRKAEFASIAAFIDTALRFELGLTTPAHPDEERMNGEPLPAGVDPMPDPEIDARGIDLLTAYVSMLAAPARETIRSDASRDSVARGEALFRDVGCSSCHTPRMRTGRSGVSSLDRKNVDLYSDLLVHDLGETMAGVCGPDASPTEHRTAMLWGLRYRDRLMFDGRARAPAEAIALHGGEASGVRNAFAALDEADQSFLLRFLASL